MAQVFPRFLPIVAWRSVRHWCERAGVDDPRSGLIPVLRLAFGLYLQRVELDTGASGRSNSGVSRRRAPRALGSLRFFAPAFLAGDFFVLELEAFMALAGSEAARFRLAASPRAP